MSFLINIIIIICSAVLILFFCFKQHLKPDDSDVVATNQDLVDESLIKPVDKSILNKTAEQEVGDSVKKLDNVKTGSSPSLTS